MSTMTTPINVIQSVEPACESVPADGVEVGVRICGAVLCSP